MNLDLKTSFERAEFWNKYENVEWIFLSYFQRGAFNYLEESNRPDSIVEWLSLMQHHGAPTRLLDFTSSPYIACYFALERAEGDCAVWAVRADTLMTETLELFYDSSTRKVPRMIDKKMFEEIFFRNNKVCVFPIEPFYMSKRYQLQQGSFLCPGDSSVSFMENLSFVENPDRNVIKIILSPSIRTEALIDLMKMNINRSTLFPDLDGFAEAIKMKFNMDLGTDYHFQKMLDLAEKKLYHFS